MLDFYFDMDGVLAVFQRWDHVETPPFMKEGGHYFLHRMPDRRAIDIFQTLYHDGTPNARVKILTRVLDESCGSGVSLELRREWWTDKRAWVLSNTSGVDTSACFLMSGENKGDLLRDVLPARRKYHILVDDFNPNLENWRAAGGTAVKYINGLNDPSSFDGLCLLKEWTAEQCVNALLALQVLA